MTQSQLIREIAEITGETVGTIRNMGFVPLTCVPFERDAIERGPLVVDWDLLDSERIGLLPARQRDAARSA